MKISKFILATLVMASLNSLGQSHIKSPAKKNGGENKKCVNEIEGYTKSNIDSSKTESDSYRIKKIRNTCGKCGKG